ncbi:glycerol-3-phosphate transporter [Dysgonomonas sp. 25]|uniref:glycerol-3-phosphate transporter n=1 Tax=Dysgonomonas sp. 25 TaxID=2302933 RepID=UPI0013CF71FF|nr:glycerol-3-phosphate transporter [Dysgonomonas sp. 25]NDV70135.1 glycerol-3-phosphate transporter [Dysgonomonas sp. 25]
MWNFFKPPAHKPMKGKDEIDPHYKKMRRNVFLGAFIGYAGYYFIRKNFSLAMPDLIETGFDAADLGIASGAISIAYGLSKFVMGSVSDRSNSRIFLSVGLILSAITMIAMGLIPALTSSVVVMCVVLFINGWFQGMGWPPCGRIMTHWFSANERGTKMAIWNVAHNVGGALMPLLAILGVAIFGDWHAKLFFPGIAAVFIAFVAYILIRDTPQSEGLPNIEEYRNDYPTTYDKSQEKEFSMKQIFLDYVLTNRLLWLVAFANAFIYLVRYGVLDWAPLYLTNIKHSSTVGGSIGVFSYEIAGIVGTLLCGWMSDKLFKGRRAPAIILYMLLVMVAVFVYWQNPAGNPLVDNIALFAIGFLIYGPVMMIGVQALDLVPKKAAGTAAGLTGFFGYVVGALFSNVAFGFIIKHFGWDAAFIILIVACLISILFTATTWNKEKKIHGVDNS